MTNTATVYKSPLHQMTQTTSHVSVERLVRRCRSSRYSIDHGAVGATCNPVIVVEVLKKEMHALEGSHPGARSGRCPRPPSTTSRGRLVEEMSIKGAELLKPIFDAHGGRNGRLSVQTDPRFYRDAEAIVRQAVHFAAARAEHHRQDPGDRRRHPRDRGSDLPRHQHQRHGLFLPAAVRRGGRGGRARPDAARARRQGHRTDGSGLHDHGRPAGRLAEGRAPTSRTSASIPACSNGRASRCSRRRIGCSRSAATASGCCRPRSGTTCTGASSSAATS